jgi:hypothetical protein
MSKVVMDKAETDTFTIRFLVEWLALAALLTCFKPTLHYLILTRLNSFERPRSFDS